MFEKEPKDNLPKAKQKWLKLGPIKLKSIVDNANKDKDVRYNSKLGRDKTSSFVKGQLDHKGECDGIVRMQNQNCIYEG